MSCFFCVDFMPRTMNNSLATTMFEGDSEVVPSTGVDAVSSAGSSVLQVGQNISTSSDALAQAMSRALTDSLPGILAALRNHNAVPSQPAPPNSDPAVISASSPAPLTQASLGQATTSGNFTVPSFVSTFSTLLMPAYGFSSLPLPSGSGSPTVGGGVVSAFPAISVSSAAVGKDFVIGLGYSPIPHKLVTKITTGLFVKLADLLPDNPKANESGTQTFLEGKLVVAPVRERIVEIQDILTWWRRLQSNPSSCVLFSRLDGLIYRTTSCSSSRDPNLMALLRRLSLLAAQHCFSFTAIHKAGKLNPVADALSRFNFQEFHLLAPHAASAATPIPADLLEELQVL